MSARQAQDAGTHDFGEHRGVGDGERDNQLPQCRQVDAELGEAEQHEVDQQQHRNRAADLDVDGGQPAQDTYLARSAERQDDSERGAEHGDDSGRGEGAEESDEQELPDRPLGEGSPFRRVELAVRTELPEAETDHAGYRHGADDRTDQDHPSAARTGFFVEKTCGAVS